MNLPYGTPAPPGNAEPVHTVIIGGGMDALSWLPRLFRDPQINLLGIAATHPADLVRNLDRHGYQLAEPCPLAIYDGVLSLAELPRIDLLVDTTVDPSTIRHLSESGLDSIPRVNSGALNRILGRVAAPGPAPAGTQQEFAERLTREVGRAYRHGRSLGLVLIHVDRNGRALPGDPAADTIIQAIEQSLRIEDVVALGPDGTLSILLPETGDDTRHVAGRLTSTLAKLRIRADADGGAGLRKSVGWAWFPQDAKTAQSLVDRARARMGDAAPFGTLP